MSRFETLFIKSGSGFPRVSGDEPMPCPPPMDSKAFSPRERG